MQIVKDAKHFRTASAWGARDLAEIEGATVRLHWTDQPYKWHVNDGSEVFLVVEGKVDMGVREGGKESSVLLEQGDIFVAEPGDEHIARPLGEARILVIEKKGSV